SFLLLTHFLSDAQFFRWGWRTPFLASSILVVVGLWVRLNLHETPVFQRALDADARERLPILTVLRDHSGALVRGTMMALCTFVLFYLMTVFALTWGTTALHFSRERFLLIQLFGVLFFGLTIPISAHLADRHGRRRMLMAASGGIALFGLLFAPLLGAGGEGPVVLFMALGLALMGLTYGPLGTVLSEQFPTAVRYTGASLAFNLAGIFGASLAPYIATWLATRYGLHTVGFYLSGAALLTLLALWGARETMHDDL
ncbi:MAG: MFS transporter, partial [Candidatus Macondimonas sp.]